MRVSSESRSHPYFAPEICFVLSNLHSGQSCLAASQTHPPPLSFPSFIVYQQRLTLPWLPQGRCSPPVCAARSQQCSRRMPAWSALCFLCPSSGRLSVTSSPSDRLGSFPSLHSTWILLLDKWFHLALSSLGDPFPLWVSLSSTPLSSTDRCCPPPPPSQPQSCLQSTGRLCFPCRQAGPSVSEPRGSWRRPLET